MAIVGPVLAKDTDSDDEVEQVIFVVSTTLDGEAVNFTGTTDSDTDGLLSDESTKNHTTLLTYVDSSQRVTDVTWTATQIGKGDSDVLLETGEKFEITVTLTALSPALDEYDTFTIEVKPAKGSALIIERTIPAVVDDTMDLR